MTVSRPLAWTLLCLTLVGSSLIRQLHEFIPEWSPLPWPARSPLYAFVVVLFLLVLANSESRPRDQPGRGRRVLLGTLIPVMLAFLYEKVLAVTLYEALLDHALRFASIRDQLNSWLHVLIGAGMTTAVLLLVPLMRGVGYRDFFGAARMRSAFYLQFLALIGTYGLLAALLGVFGRGAGKPVLFFPVGSAVTMLILGQGVRALAEEFYYRGLLQRELSSLMPSLGVGSERNGQALAVAMISLGFGLEHFRFGAPWMEAYRSFAYAVAAGFLFGYLLILTGNVFFCGLVHATNNFVTSGVMPRLGTQGGGMVIPAETVLYIYLIAVFLLVFLASRARRGQFRRVLLPDSGRSART